MKNNFYFHETKEHLKVIYIRKKGFVKSYCGIGCNFGGADIVYLKNGKKMTLPYGIAHFLEHKLFTMPDGSDAFREFDKQYAYANAYTASDKTIYYFSKNDSIENSLELLIKMYFTPIFTKEDVEKEKSIIQSEIRMYQDSTDYKIYQKGLNSLYPEDDYSYPIAGYEKDILGITPEDLYEAYHAFYTTRNSILCVISDQEPEVLFSFIDSVMAQIVFPKEDKIQKLPTITSKKCLKPMTIEEKVFQEECMVLLRLDDVDNTDSIACEKLLGVIDSILSVSSKHYQDLEKKNLIENSIDYQVLTYRESSYISITGVSKKPEILAKSLIKKIKNLLVEDIDSSLIELYLCHLKAKTILMFDRIESLGENVLSLALEGIDYRKQMDEIATLTKEDILEVLPKIKNAKMTYIITKMQNE